VQRLLLPMLKTRQRLGRFYGWSLPPLAAFVLAPGDRIECHHLLFSLAVEQDHTVISEELRACIFGSNHSLSCLMLRSIMLGPLSTITALDSIS
jgi:hypothetical protein